MRSFPPGAGPADWNSCGISGGRYHRKVYRKGAPLSWLAGHPDVSPMAFDDSMNHGKAHPGSLTRALGGKVWVEDPFQDLTLHAMTRIAHRKSQIWPRSEIVVSPSVGPFDLDPRERHFQRSAVVAHGMIGVRTEVHHHLMDLGGIGHDGTAIPVYLLSDLNRGGKR